MVVQVTLQEQLKTMKLELQGVELLSCPIVHFLTAFHNAQAGAVSSMV